MGSRRKQSDIEDDGRVIAPMNVPGMPFYVQRPESGEAPKDGGAPEPMTRGEKLAFAGGVLKAVLLVTGVFLAVYLGFILFCTEIWFR